MSKGVRKKRERAKERRVSLGSLVRKSHDCVEGSPEVRWLSGSQAKWKLGMEVCRCRRTMLASLDYADVESMEV